MLRPIAAEYTSRYSTGRPSREKADALGVEPVTAAIVAIITTAAVTAARRWQTARTAGPLNVQTIGCSTRPFRGMRVPSSADIARAKRSHT
jgi:hypothetical protein